MSNTHQWKGYSNETYKTSIHPLENILNIHEGPFTPNDKGFFIFAKFQDNVWKAIQIGEGNLKECIIKIRDKGEVLRKGATHVHVFIDEREYNRGKAVSDLLLNYKEAYKPIGCNEK